MKVWLIICDANGADGRPIGTDEGELCVLTSLGVFNLEAEESNMYMKTESVGV